MSDRLPRELSDETYRLLYVLMGLGVAVPLSFFATELIAYALR